jgi:BirA family transcriptional regulator, biotin operon repressor / biotin---[acetyl-CoA-carboxylase] ligase
MLHKTFDKLESTQETLKECFRDLDEPTPVLVSTQNQTKGRGRMGKDWHFCKDSLAFSFSLSPSEVLTLSSIEVGILIAKFFKQTFQQTLFLKWPNDLLSADGKKCGGILIETLTQKILAVGVGINLGPSSEMIDEANFKMPMSFLSILNSEGEKIQITVPEKIYTYILANRLSTNEIYSLWDKFCFHKNHIVLLENGNQKIRGKFLGIGKSGEAIIETNGTKSIFFSGSLTLI